jgi:thioesterase domain-containing protein
MPDRMTYDKLATYLPEDQPLYCLEMIPERSIEENARHFIAEMKAIQPHGPYNLGGHCGSGLIALEMGRQLLAEGEDVQLLALFESYGPEAMLPRTSPRYWMGKVKLYQELLSNLSLKQKMYFPFKEIKRI